MSFKTGSHIKSFSGAHGTGKTFSMSRLFMQEKLQNPTKMITELHENLVFCPHPINLEATREGQAWVFTDQATKEIELLAKFDIVINDRSIVDCLGYSAYHGFNDLVDSLIGFAKLRLAFYRKIIFIPINSSENRLYADGLRDASNKGFQLGVQEHLLNVYRSIGLVPNEKNDLGIEFVLQNPQKVLVPAAETM